MLDQTKINRAVLEGGYKAKVVAWIKKRFPFGTTGDVEEDCTFLVLKEVFESMVYDDESSSEQLREDFRYQIAMIVASLEKIRAELPR